jgi:protein phosphatase
MVDKPNTSTDKGPQINFLKKYSELITPGSPPVPRFGHTVNLVSKSTVVVFGGAVSNPGSYTMTADLFLYNMVQNLWKKLDCGNNNAPPQARAAHSSATVRENQLLIYGGSIGSMFLN